MDKLVFQTNPTVTIATNTFINVPHILRFEQTDLISIVKHTEGGHTIEIPIYHADGTYLTKVRGNVLEQTEAGDKAQVVLVENSDVWVGKMGSQILFEIRQQRGEAFKMTAELYAPEGYLVKCNDDVMPLACLHSKVMPSE